MKKNNLDRLIKEHKHQSAAQVRQVRFITEQFVSKVNLILIKNAMAREKVIKY